MTGFPRASDLLDIEPPLSFSSFSSFALPEYTYLIVFSVISVALISTPVTTLHLIVLILIYQDMIHLPVP